MVTNNIIPLHFKTRAQKHFFPLKECVLVTGLADIKILMLPQKIRIDLDNGKGIAIAKTTLEKRLKLEN